ncbi:MAG: hypothetical protein KGN02_08400 [bacterium]|nr:hypothetical protein [bacterium]
MRARFVFTLALLTIALVSLSPRPARSWALVCEATIPATMVDRVDSATAYPGMRFRFKLTTTARLNGHLVPSGTIGYGYVRQVSAASNRNRNGSLVLEMREIIYHGIGIQVMADPRETTLWAPATTLAERAAGYMPLPGLFRTAVNQVRDGRNVTIGPGFKFHIVALGDPRTMEPCHKVGR